MNDELRVVLEKHLIGQHDQADHSRKQHGTKKDPTRLSDTQRRTRLSMALLNPASAYSALDGTTLIFPNNWGKDLPLMDNRQIFESDTRSMIARAAPGAVAGGPIPFLVGGGLGYLSDQRRMERGDYKANVHPRAQNLPANKFDRKDFKNKSEKKKKVKKGMLPVEERIAKHLIGQHDQSDHVRGDHKKLRSGVRQAKDSRKAETRNLYQQARDDTVLVRSLERAFGQDPMVSNAALERRMREYRRTDKPYKKATKEYLDAKEKYNPRRKDKRKTYEHRAGVDQRRPVKKADTEFYAEFSKLDDDKKQVFGWASIVAKDGKTVVDRQMDTITPDDLETAAYSYVLKSRDGGEMHKRRGVATLVESFVVTPEKVAKLGLPEDSLPTGWWVGFQIKDDDVWDKVKKGHYTGFSIHGMGKRTKMSVDELFAQ